MKLSLIVGALLGALASSSVALAQGPKESPPPLPPPTASTPTTPTAPDVETPAPAEADRGNRGESCRARSDCKTGLACVQNVCRYANEGQTCGARAECGAPLACIHRVCVVEGEQGVAALPADRGPLHESAQTEAPDAAPKYVPPPIEHPVTIELDQVFFTQTESTLRNGVNNLTNTWWSSILAARFRAPHFEAEAELPWAVELHSFESQSATHVAGGNVTGGLFYANDFRGGTLRAGGSLALPTASSSANTIAPLDGAAASRGLDRVWHWVPNAVTIAPSVRFASREGNGFQHASELVFAAIAPTDGGDTHVFVQLSADLGGQASLFRAGARLEVVTDTHATRDASQLSLLPYAGVRAAQWFADGGMLINVTSPYGFSFDEGKVWGLRARVGARF